MAKLWVMMTSMFGHKWTSAHGLEDDGIWAKTLAGLSGVDIARGMHVCIEQKLPWPPSAPEFRGFCEAAPQAFGLPSEDQAYLEACKNAHPAMEGASWSHEAVYHAACETGFYNLNTLKMADSKKLFVRNYIIAQRLVMDGKPLRSAPVALPEKVDTKATPEVGRAALANLRASLGMSKKDREDDQN